MKRLVLWIGLIALVTSVGSAAPVHAQDRIPRNPDAELLFEQGLAAFERGEFGVAHRRFRLVNDYPLNRKTTAALLMAGQSLYRMERYRDAIDVLTTLKNRYPSTTYRDDADQLIEAAREARSEFGQAADTLRIGVALSLQDQDATLTQALFNGIRLAVDRHNGLRRRYVLPPRLRTASSDVDVFDTADVYGDSLAEAAGRTTLATPTDTIQVDSLQIVTERTGTPGWVAKMFFRDTAGSPDGARAAVDSLVRLDRVDVVVGPLYSREARAAGDAAERARVLLVPPLATEESVSEGRNYVFQANPTIPLRGRIMARFAANSLLTKSAGIIYESGNDISARMADGFRDEAQSRGIDVTYTLRLDNPRSWSRLPNAFSADSTITDSLLAVTEAVYLPISGRNASGKIQDALTGLGRVNPEVRVLGNAEWHDLSIEQEASKFLATYTNDFYVQTERREVQDFIRDYRILTGDTPDGLSVTGQRLAYTGYDVTHFLLQTLRPGTTRPDPRVLRQAPAYEGLGLRIDFRGTNVNQATFFHRYRSNRIELVR